MRVISYEAARVTMLFPFEEIAPLGGGDGRAIITAISQKYSFSHLPDLSVSRDEINKNGIKFEGGIFEFEGKPANIHTLGVYNDGVNIDANISDHADAFLNELLVLLRAEFSFREFTSRPRKHFWSQIVVEFDSPIANLINEYEKICAVVRENVAPHYEMDLPPCAFGRLDFRWDTSKPAISEPAPRFVIERRLNVAFEQERYFCGASMRTQNHEQVLQAIERLAS